MYRIGQSTDIHAFVEGKPLVIGGVTIPFDKGFEAHSDGDILIHAIAEAILGALGLNDLGHLFPDNDPKTEGIDSKKILKEVVNIMDLKGYKINNVDSLVIIEKPKLYPYIDSIRKTLSNLLFCSIEDVNVKATTSEHLGFIGKEKGAEAQAVVMLIKK